MPNSTAAPKPLLPFGEALITTAERHAFRPAIRHRGTVITYGELLDRTQTVAGALHHQGLQPGDRVLLVCEEKLPLLLCHLGVMLAGGVSVPLNPGFTPDELSYFLSDSGARLAVATGPPAEVLKGLVEEQGRDCRVVAPEMLLDSERSSEPSSFAPEQNAFMLYTSGTTGRPKGAVHTHRNLTAAVSALAECWQFTPEDVLLNCLPLYHIHGLSFACHVALLSGCELILADRFHPRRTLEQIQEATVFYGVPPYYYSFLERPEFGDWARRWDKLRLMTCGSAPIRPEVLPELDAILGRPLINRYGMTETHVISSLPVNGPAKQGSVGLPLPGIELIVRDGEGQPVAEGAVGQVWVRGPNLFDCYWQQPEATRDAFDHDGWFATGDLGELDADGFVTLRGREKDLILVGGFNVYPPVVERVLNACPGVRESAVIGVPDAKRGERVVAVVVKDDPALTESAVRGHCRERLVDYQRPSRVLFTEQLPRNTMGKVLKRELRESSGNA